MSNTKKIERSSSEIYLEQAIRDGRAKATELSMRVIRNPDQKFQSRIGLDMDHVRSLADIVDRGEDLARIIVFFDKIKEKYYLADGFHRHRVYHIKKIDHVRAWVIEGNEQDAILYSVSANLKFSLTPSIADRKKAAWMILGDPILHNLSNPEIARRCGINTTTAQKYAHEYRNINKQQPPSTVKYEENGKFIEVERISVPRINTTVKNSNPHPTNTPSFSENEQLYKFMIRRGMLASTNNKGVRDTPLTGVFLGFSCFVILKNWSKKELLYSIGYARILRAQYSKYSRAIIVYCSDCPGGESTNIKLIAEKDGIEFMDTEKLVSEFIN